MSEPARARLLRQKGPLSFARQPSERLSVLQKHVLTSAVTIAASGLSKGPKPSDKDATFDLGSNTWEWANGSNLGDEALSANSHILHPALNAGASEINQLLSRPLTIHKRAAGLAVQLPRPMLEPQPRKPHIGKGAAELRSWRRDHQTWLTQTIAAMSDASEAEIEQEDNLAPSERMFNRMIDHLERLDWPTDMRWTLVPRDAPNLAEVILCLPETMRRSEMTVERSDFGLSIDTKSGMTKTVYAKCAFAALSMAAAISVGLYLRDSDFSLRIIGVTQDPEKELADTDISIHDGFVVSMTCHGPIWTSRLISSDVPSAEALLTEDFAGLSVSS